MYGCVQQSGHGTLHSHGDGWDAWTQCHMSSVVSKVQQQTLSSVVVVVVAAVVSVVVELLDVVVVVVVTGAPEVFRQTHVPLGRHTEALPGAHGRSWLHCPASAQLVQRQTPAASQRGIRAAPRTRRHHRAQSSWVWHRPNRRDCRVQMPCVHVGLKFPCSMQSAVPEQ